MIKLKNISLYNQKDQLVNDSYYIGNLYQEKSKHAFTSSLNLTGDDPSKLIVGESYYAVGIREDGMPIRTEKIICTKKGNNPSFEGSTRFPERPKDYQPKKESVGFGMEPPDMFIQFTNYSSDQFDRSIWGASLEAGFGGLTNSPGPILMAHSGQQSIGANQLINTLDEGPADICLSWSNYANFGVWIHFNFQMFTIGPRPIWYVTTNGSKWTLAGKNPAEPYTWDAKAVGYNIIGTPTSGHSSLSVSVVITNIN